MERRRSAERKRVHQILCVLAKKDRARYQFLQAAADDGRAVPAHEYHGVRPERARERASLFRLGDQQVGVAELIMLIPERRYRADRRAKMEYRSNRLAGDAERHHRWRVMMANRDDIATRLIDATVND